MATQDTRKHFRDAVGILVDEKGTIKERLMIAYISQLSGIKPSQDLPEQLVPTFAGIRGTLTADEVDGDRGTVSKQLKTITDDDASQIARQIFEIFLELSNS